MADDEGYVETRVENMRLRERVAELEIDLAKWVQFWRDKDIAALKVRIEELESAMREIYEVYAGSDGFIPETCAEGYQQQLIKEMVEIAAKHMRKK